MINPNDHGPPSAPLRPPAAPARSTHGGRDHRHRSRCSSVDGARVAPHRADGGGQFGCGEPDRAGTPIRGPQTPTTRPETRSAAPARAGAAAHLRLHVGRRAITRRSRQAANPACHRSGSRLHFAANSPAAAPPVAESVPRLATATHRVRTRRSVVLSAYVAASADTIRDPGDPQHGDLVRIPARSHWDARGPGPAARNGLGVPSTWYRLARRFGWRRPRLQVHPAKPK